MAVRFQLETFDTAADDTEAVLLNLSDLEEAKLAAFEKGYSAGWEDAVAAQDTEAARLHADLGRSLQELSFTYHEARVHVLHAMEPLLRDMVSKVLPLLGRESLSRIVLEHLLPLAEGLADAPLQVMLNPASRDTVEDHLAARSSMPLRFVEEPSLGEGQVYLRLGETETRVDLDGVVTAIAAAVAGFFQLENEVTPHG
jgi:flagellar assembly protein FliH